MPLSDTGHPYINDMTGQSARAEDGSGNAVTVSASHEAIQGYGWDVIWDAASAKYDAGDYQIKDGAKVVRVTTDDCQNA